MLQDLGADETLCYQNQRFDEVYPPKSFDFIFDPVGGVSQNSVF